MVRSRRVLAVAPDDTGMLREAYAAWLAVQSARGPMAPVVGAQVWVEQARRLALSGDGTWFAVLTDDGCVAVAQERAPSAWDTDKLWGWVGTRPGHEGLGHGRALAELLHRRAAERGRAWWLGHVREALDGRSGRADQSDRRCRGQRFATAVGMRVVLTESVQALALPLSVSLSVSRSRGLTGPDVAAMTGTGTTGEAQAQTWSPGDELPAPEALTGIAALMNRLGSHSPTGEVRFAVRGHTGSSVEQALRSPAPGRTATVAWVWLGGQVVAYSEHDHEAGARHWVQAGTVVHPDHRGRGLARLVKAVGTAEVARLDRRLPGTRSHIETVNAESNVPMVALNASLGFVPVERQLLVAARLRG